MFCLVVSDEINSGSSRKEQKLVCSEDVAPGTILLQEEPLLYLLKTSEIQRRCYNCWKHKSTVTEIKRCAKCRVPRYCSKECQVN